MIVRKVIGLVGLLVALAMSHGVNAQTLTDIYVNHFNINSDGTAGGYNGGFSKNGQPMSYAPADQVGARVRLAPNTSICDEQTTQAGIDYWCGNQYVQVLTFANDPIPASGGATSGTFKGCFGVNDMAAGYQLKAFLKIFNSDYTQTWYSKEESGPGCWDIPYSTDGSADAVLQRGFIVEGRSVSGTVGATLGEAYAFIGVDSPPGNIKDLSNTAPIPAMPMYLIALMAGLLGLFGYRKMAAK